MANFHNGGTKDPLENVTFVERGTFSSEGRGPAVPSPGVHPHSHDLQLQHAFLGNKMTKHGALGPLLRYSMTWANQMGPTWANVAVGQASQR